MRRRSSFGRWYLGLLLGAAMVLGSAADGPSILDHHGPEARHVASTWWLMFGLATGVYVVVASLVIIAALRGRRHRNGPGPVVRGTPERPIEAGDTTWIWVGGIILPVAILSVMAVVTVTTTQAVRNPQPDALEVVVNGERWWWDVEYPESGVRTANEIRVPVGQPIDLVLRSDNVVHSFWVPQLAGKVDLVPGQTNHLHFEVTDPGTYRGQCAEFCGIAHARMAFVVIAQTPGEFERWIARRSAVGGAPGTEETAAGQRVFLREACAGCHTVNGTPAEGRVGPDLSDFGARSSIAALTLTNTPENLRQWITDPEQAKPGSLMPPTQLDDDDLDALVAYLESLG